jgi:hypothetical protein
MRARPSTTIEKPLGEYLREQLDARKPDGTQGAALAQGLSMLDSIRPDDPLGWLADYLQDPASETWAEQARAARARAGEMTRRNAASAAASGGAHVSSVEYLGRLRPHLHAALRSLAESRPSKDSTLVLSDYLGSSRGAVLSSPDEEAEREPLGSGADGARAEAEDEVVE